MTPMIHRRDLQRMLGVSAETIRRWLRSGKLPPPDVAVSHLSSYWRRETLERAGVRVGE